MFLSMFNKRNKYTEKWVSMQVETTGRYFIDVHESMPGERIYRVGRLKVRK